MPAMSSPPSPPPATAISCNSCSAAFPDEAGRGDHYRSDWHRYNLKRKASVPSSLPLPGPGGSTPTTTTAAAAAAAAVPLPEELVVRPAPVRPTPEEKFKELSLAAESKGNAARDEAGAGGRPRRAAATGSTAARGGLTPVGEEEAAGGGAGRQAAQPGVGGEDDDEEEEEEEWEEVADGEEEEEEEDDDHPEAASADHGVDAEGGPRATAAEGGGDAALAEAEDEAASVSSDTDGDRAGGEEAEEGDFEWDAGRCLFCQKECGGGGVEEGGVVEASVEHMHREHGFFIPDAEFLKDPADLIAYLALKINRGFMCLYCDDRGRQYGSAEAVRRHMRDRSHCKLRYGDGSNEAEDELAEFYDFSASYTEGDMQLVAGHAEPPVMLLRGGLELVIKGGGASGGTQGGKILGARELARYYKQKPRPSEDRSGVMKNAIIARYRSMGLSTRQQEWVKRGSSKDTGANAKARADNVRTRVGMKNNVIWNLPKNVPY
eukprot:jgi/Mesen1/3535/ME000198S02737